MTCTLPIDAAPVRMPRMYLWLAGLAMVSSWVVFREPAPYDIALILLLVFGTLLGRLAFHAEHRLPLLLMGGFLAANVIPLAYAVDLKLAVFHLSINTYLAASWLLFVGLTTAHGSRSIDVLMRGYTVAAMLAVLLSALAFFGVIPHASLFLGAGRAKGLFKDPNVFGPFVVPVVLFALTRLQRKGPGRISFWLNLAVCAAGAMGVFLSFSRAAWINCAVAVAGLLGLQLLSGILRRTVSMGMVYSLLLIVLLVGGVGFLGISGDTAVGRMLSVRLGHSGLHNYDAVRFETHRQALDKAIQNPLGIGPGQSEMTFQISTHNMYLRILAETGFLGFVAFYGFVALSLLRALKRALTESDEFSRDVFMVAAVSLFGTLINGLVIDTIHWRHFWFLLALAWWVPVRGYDSEEVEA